MSSCIRPQDFPILTAVYFLSPVSIHTLMPAFLSFTMVSLTLSCSLSSIAVDPIRVNYFSRISYNSHDEQELDESMSLKYLSIKIFWFSLRTLLSFKRVFIIDYGLSIRSFYVAVSESSMIIFPIVYKDITLWVELFNSKESLLINSFFSFLF